MTKRYPQRPGSWAQGPKRDDIKEIVPEAAQQRQVDDDPLALAQRSVRARERVTHVHNTEGAILMTGVAPFVLR